MKKRERKTRQLKRVANKTIADRLKNLLTTAFALSIFGTWGSMFYWTGGYRFPGQQGPVLRWHGWPVQYMGCSLEGATHCMMKRWALVQNFAAWMVICTVMLLIAFGIFWGANYFMSRWRKAAPSAELEPAMEGVA